MHIQVHHQQLAHQTLQQQHPGRHGEVVEDAEATAVVGKGMVGAARQVAGQALLQCQPGGEHRTAHRQPAAAHQRCGGGQTDAPHRSRLQLVAGKALVIGPAMHQLQPAPRHRQGLVQLLGPRQIKPLQMLDQKPKFTHRKTVGAGQGSRILRVINEGRTQGGLPGGSGAGGWLAAPWLVIRILAEVPACPGPVPPPWATGS